MTTLKTMVLAICVGCLGVVVRAETPDFLADRLRSDAVGYVNLGYKYKVATLPQTSRMEFDFYSPDYGTGTKLGGPTSGVSSPALMGTSWPLYFRYNGHNKGEVVDNGTLKGQFLKGAGNIGNVSITFDFISKSGTWGTESYTGAKLPATDDSLACFLFAVNSSGSAGSKSVYEFKTLKFYEKDGEGTESLAHEFVPCFANGQAAVYDKTAQVIKYPTSSGFRIFGYDIATVAGRPLIVNEVDAAPRTLTLAAGSELVFDGKTTLEPTDSMAVLPESGTVTVSLAELTGKGRYVLIGNLPQGAAASSFGIGSLPRGCTGTLSVEDGKLILMVSSQGVFPDALAATLTSDAHGYIDTGYKFKAVTLPRTSRFEMDFHTGSDCGKGVAPGPVSGSTVPNVFGYWISAGNRFAVRYNGTNGQVFYSKTDTGYQFVRSGQTGDVSLSCDFIRQTFQWGATTLSEFVSPTVDSARSVYIFDYNDNGSPNNARSVFDFKGMRFYEINGAEVEILACDLVPCVKDGKPGVYDYVSQAVSFPIASTNGFKVADAKWRLTANGEVIFTSGDVSIPAAVSAAGWIAVRDADGGVVARGNGATAEFVMPEAATTVRWAQDLEVASRLQIVEPIFARSVTIAANAALEFVDGSVLYAADKVILPPEGVVTVSMSGLRAAGVYTLIDGLDEASSLSTFAVGTLPDGFAGRLEIHGRRLVVRVSGALTSEQALPDALATTLRSDGEGYIDTEYRYKGETYPRTSQFVFSFDSPDYGKGTERGPVSTSGNPALFGYERTENDRFAARYNDTMGQLFYSGSTYWKVRSGQIGDLTISCDFSTGAATWGANAKTDVVAPTVDAQDSIYFFARNMKGKAEGMSVFDFRRMAFYERQQSGSETIVHDFVPCVKDGRACVYDLETQTCRFPKADTNGFAVSGLNWPDAVFGASVRQVFSLVTTESRRPVSVPAFAPEGEYTFVADGTIVLVCAAEAMTIRRYAANGAELSSDRYVSLSAGAVHEVALNGGVRAVVSVVGALQQETVAQDLGIVAAHGMSETFVRQTSKRRYELLVTDDVLFTAKTDLGEVFADSYDAAGDLIGTTKVAGAVAEGGSFIVEKGDAAKVVVRVTLVPPAGVLFIR